MSMTNGEGPAPPTRVVLRPLGSPLGLGMSGLAVVSLLGAGFGLGWIAPTSARQVGLLVVVTVVPMQAAASLLAFLARDGATGGSFGLQAATWAAYGASHLVSRPGTRSGATGLVLLAAGALLTLSGATAATTKPLVGAAVALSGVHFVLAALYELGTGSGWQRAAGGVALAVVAVAGYTAWAGEVEDMAGRPVLPMLRRGAARASAEGRAPEQRATLAHEPGVRPQL